MPSSTPFSGDTSFWTPQTHQNQVIGRLRRENHYNGGAIWVPSHEFEAYMGNVGLKVLRGSRVPHFPIPPKRSQAKFDLGQGKGVAKVCIKRHLRPRILACSLCFGG
jgi:hypothetical protein